MGAVGTDTWRVVAACAGTGWADRRAVAAIRTNSLTVTGGPALGTLTVRPVPGTDGTLLAGKRSGRCADIYDNTITNGTEAELRDCNGGDNQKWSGT